MAAPLLSAPATLSAPPQPSTAMYAPAFSPPSTPLPHTGGPPSPYSAMYSPGMMPLLPPPMLYAPISPMPHHHHPASPQHVPAAASRTVYLGNLPSEASVDELLDLIRHGPLESVRVVPAKQCAFISFLSPLTAAAFHADATCARPFALHGQPLRVGWGRPIPLPGPVAAAVTTRAATRNVYIGNLDPSFVTRPNAETELRDRLSNLGPIDQVKLVHDRRIAFVHFLSISTAMAAVTTLSSDPSWSDHRINFGRDRCSHVSRAQQENQAHNHRSALAAAAQVGASFYEAPHPNMPEPNQLGNRCVFLGNIHPDCTTEELCNHIRGGILQSIRYLRDRHIAFVTFVDPNAAYAFVSSATHHDGHGRSGGLTIHSRRIKIGWGRPSGPLAPALAMAVQAGGSRNVYVGNLAHPSHPITEEKLKEDFAVFGETEQINSLPEKNCAFINFCSLQNAIRAIAEIKDHPDYNHTRISHGKDRCGGVRQSQATTSSPNPGNRSSFATPTTPPMELDDSGQSHAAKELLSVPLPPFQSVADDLPTP